MNACTPLPPFQAEIPKAHWDSNSFFSHYNVLRRELKEAKKIQNKHEIPYEIQTYTNGITINDLYLCATEKDKRKQLLQDGKIAAQSFLKYLNNFTSSINDKK